MAKRKKKKGSNFHPSVRRVTPYYGAPRDDFNDDFDRDETWFVLALFAAVWGTYWGIVHIVDKFTFNFMPWWIEPLTAFPLVGWLALAELFGRNPLHWWPLVWGTKIKMKHWHDDPMVRLRASAHAMVDTEELIQKLGGPLNVYQIDNDTLKFRRKKDITIYLLFTK